jgi:Nif-specific regulatory protein
MEHKASSDKIKKVLDLGRRISSERDLRTLLDLISFEAKDLVEADRLSVFLLDREKNELWSMVTQDSESIRFDARLGIAGAAVSTGKTVNVHDAYQDSRFLKKVDQETGFRTRNLIAVPLKISDGQVIGVCECLNKNGGAFTAEDESVLEVFAEQASGAIENAQIFDELQKNRDQLREENRSLRLQMEARSSTQNIIGMSAKIQSIVRLIDQLRDTSVDVLILGESGTGKELVAKALHCNSPRAGKPFVALNCAALPESLVESELFGIEKGVATGVNQRVGKFEEAQGGTLFLDEIGDLSPGAQAKILRVLQERVLDRVGSRSPVPLDVRIIAATNHDLEAAVKQGHFRDDLYFRLNVVQIRTAALREVPEDVPLLAKHFMAQYCEAMQVDQKEFSPDAIEALQAYDWPGNVRQLANEVQRLVVSVRVRIIPREYLHESIAASGRIPPSLPSSSRQPLRTAVETLERRMISETLSECRGNQRKTAQLLGLSRQGLIKKIKRYGIT